MCFHTKDPVYKHAGLHMPACTHVDTCVCTRACAQIYRNTNVCINACLHLCIGTSVQICICAHLCVYICAYTYKVDTCKIYTCIHFCIYIMYTCMNISINLGICRTYKSIWTCSCICINISIHQGECIIPLFSNLLMCLSIQVCLLPQPHDKTENVPWRR